jgi:hypothetical protein
MQYAFRIMQHASCIHTNASLSLASTLSVRPALSASFANSLSLGPPPPLKAPFYLFLPSPSGPGVGLAALFNSPLRVVRSSECLFDLSLLLRWFHTLLRLKFTFRLAYESSPKAAGPTIQKGIAFTSLALNRIHPPVLVRRQFLENGALNKNELNPTRRTVP